MREQLPADTAQIARALCIARLICDNDSTFHRSVKAPRDVAAALQRACEPRLGLREWCRIAAGYGAGCLGARGIPPWYDSLFDPEDPKQVRQESVKPISPEDMDAVLSGYPSHTAKVKAMTECYGAPHTSVGEWNPNIQAVQKEPTMSNPTPIKIETRVFIDGVQASGFTIDQLHQKVREQEAVIKDLEKIENKSKKLGAEITKRYESIKALNEYIDGLPD